MNLDIVVKKLTDLAKKIKGTKGPLELFGLFLRDDSPDLWDIVVAAPWLKADERASFEYMAGELRDSLSSGELSGLSRIVILEHDGAVLKSFLERFSGQTGLADVHFVTEGGAIIRTSYIIVARLLREGVRRQSAKKTRRKKAVR